MFRTCIVTCALAALLLGLTAGCGGVILSPEYSRLVDETAALSDETARRAEAGGLSEQQKTDALRSQARLWKRFRDARDGKVK